MINLLTFFKVHFDTPEISDNNLYKFAEDHIERLNANNDKKEYDSMLNNTVPIFNAFFESMGTEDTRFSQQQGKTLAVDSVIAEFKETVSLSEGLIRYTYKPKSSEYQEFFPGGVTEYSNAIKANIYLLMNRMVKLSEKYSIKLGADFVNTFVDIEARYRIARANQLQDIGRVTANKSVTEETRSVLEIQLMRNLLDIASKFVGNPSRGMDFFDQSIIRRNTTSTDEGETITGTLIANESKTVFKGFDSNAEFMLNNTGDTLIRFCVSKTENEACTTNGINIEPGVSVTVKVFDLNAEGGDKLNVTNLDSQKAAKYIVERLV